MAELKTVKINNPKIKGEFLIINETDLVSGEHTLFGEAENVESADELAELMKLNKADLITLATEKGIEIVPDEVNKRQIADKILAAE